MFLSQSQVESAVKRIKDVHPFFGISFLVCKECNLPIGSVTSFAVNKKEEEFLQKYYMPDADSKWFYRAFRVSDKKQFWLKPDYASSGSQRGRTGTFGKAFMHTKGTDQWGWSENYISELESLLDLNKNKTNRKVPAYELAVWLYRDMEWPKNSTKRDVLERFKTQFNLSDTELFSLFDSNSSEEFSNENIFSNSIFSWREFAESFEIPFPPDAPADEGGTLSLLELRGVGPAHNLSLKFADRTNLLTGDNGLGKSFILESAWWALSGNWTSFQALPREDAGKNEPRISFQIASNSGKKYKISSEYNWENQEWVLPTERPTVPGLLIYARVDGAFAVWDPARDYWGLSSKTSESGKVPIVFSRDDVWNGLSVSMGGKTNFLSNGLITDWINWQNSPEIETFNTLRRVLLRLSPPSLELGDLGCLEPGKPRRIPGDSRLIPTIRHSYGEVPIVYASAGVRRIVALAYLIVWVWEEHKTQSKLVRKDPEKRMVILIDEIEAHLHPQWQRRILPALFDVCEDLNSDIQVQTIVATHSPLVMASVEPIFDTNKDKIFHIDLVKTDILSSQVDVTSPDFVIYGTVDSWLKSEFFELGQARSIEAEKAINDAKFLQQKNEVSSEAIKEVSERLVRYLSSHDEFWPRWTYYAAQYGVEL